MLSAVVCRFYIPCITVNPPIDRYYGSDQSMIPDSELRVVVSETDGAVLSLAWYPYGTTLMMGSSRRLRENRVLTIDRPVGQLTSQFTLSKSQVIPIKEFALYFTVFYSAGL